MLLSKNSIFLWIKSYFDFCRQHPTQYLDLIRFVVFTCQEIEKLNTKYYIFTCQEMANFHWSRQPYIWLWRWQQGFLEETNNDEEIYSCWQHTIQFFCGGQWQYEESIFLQYKIAHLPWSYCVRSESISIWVYIENLYFYQTKTQRGEFVNRWRIWTYHRKPQRGCGVLKKAAYMPLCVHQWDSPRKWKNMIVPEILFSCIFDSGFVRCVFSNHWDSFQWWICRCVQRLDSR